jgi:hypothetical protein
MFFFFLRRQAAAEGETELDPVVLAETAARLAAEKLADAQNEAQSAKPVIAGQAEADVEVVVRVFYLCIDVVPTDVDVLVGFEFRFVMASSTSWAICSPSSISCRLNL